MATRFPSSTISYNSEPFLKEKLDAWLQAHYIQAYQYIKHKGEDGDKDHIHLRIEPNKTLDLMSLSAELSEFVIGSDKPLGVRPWRPSKEEDWFLYVVHDIQYLSVKYSDDKHEKLPYDYSDIIVSEGYDLETAFIRAKASLKHSSANLANRIRSGESSLNLILSGENPFTVNSLVNAITRNDLSSTISELTEIRQKYIDLLEAVENAGFSVDFSDNGKIFLKKT